MTIPKRRTDAAEPIDRAATRQISSSTTIAIGGDGTFAFSAAHAGLHDGEFEPLHGHTFTVTLRLTGEPDETGMVCDFTDVKKALSAAIAPLKRRTLMPMRTFGGRCDRLDGQVIIEVGSKRYSLPEDDVVLLPIANTTTELIAEWILRLILPSLARTRVRRVELELAEACDTSASVTIDLGATG